VRNPKNPQGRLWRRVASERASVYLEYTLLTALLFSVAVAAFSPTSVINEALGADLSFREVLIKLPIF